MALTTTALANRIKANVEAINNFPRTGEHPLIVDMRFITAVSQAIVDTLQQDADVSPASHSGSPLQNPTGQPSTGADPQGGTVNSTTSAAANITGLGKIL